MNGPSLYKKINPTVKAVKNKNYKIDEDEEQIIENMDNAKDNNFDGHKEIEIRKEKDRQRSIEANKQERIEDEMGL